MKNRRFHGSSTLIAGVLLTATACVYGTGRIPDTRRAQDIEGAVHLNVTNHSNGPMEIYATGRGTSYRIGTVLPGLRSLYRETDHDRQRARGVHGPVGQPQPVDPFRRISARPWERRGLRA